MYAYITDLTRLMARRSGPAARQREMPMVERRDRQRPLKVYVTPGERLRIEQRAAAVRLSVSAYLRSAGLGHQVKSLLDQEQLLKLIKVNGDQAGWAGCLSCG
jgi:hypothetical protein